MDLSDLLAPNAVRVLGTMSGKKRLLQELGEIAQTAYRIDAMVAMDALQERESLESTGVGQGVAIPHGRLDGLDRVVGVFIRLERAIDFEAVDRQPVDLVFALFAPRDSVVEHLKALASVSRTLRDQGVCAKLRANSDPAALHAVLTASKADRAA